MFFHADTKFNLHVFDDDSMCIELRESGLQLHLDLLNQTMTLTNDEEGVLAIHDVKELCKSTEGSKTHERVMEATEDEAHLLNGLYDRYKAGTH